MKPEAKEEDPVIKKPKKKSTKSTESTELPKSTESTKAAQSPATRENVGERSEGGVATIVCADLKDKIETAASDARSSLGRTSGLEKTPEKEIRKEKSEEIKKLVEEILSDAAPTESAKISKPNLDSADAHHLVEDPKRSVDHLKIPETQSSAPVDDAEKDKSLDNEDSDYTYRRKSIG